MEDPIERGWAVRDAVLKWLYIKKFNGVKAPPLSAADIATTAGWVGSPLTQPEVADASNDLKARGLVTGSGAMGAGVIRPMITPDGEDLVVKEQSVKPTVQPVPANPTGAITITAHGSNVSVNSQHVEQSIKTGADFPQVMAVAEALEKAAADEEPAAADEARRVASEIRAELEQPQPEESKLKGIITGVTKLAVASGPILELAIAALGAL